MDVEIDRDEYRPLVERTRSYSELTVPDEALLTFLSDRDNVMDALGEKASRDHSHWQVAEVYFTEAGLHASVLCEDGYTQKPLYFHYNESEKLWYRVKHLEDAHGKGVPAAKLK